MLLTYDFCGNLYPQWCKYASKTQTVQLDHYLRACLHIDYLHGNHPNLRQRHLPQPALVPPNSLRSWLFGLQTLHGVHLHADPWVLQQVWLCTPVLVCSELCGLFRE